jgi:transposase
MKLESIDIEEAVTKIKRLLKEEQGLSPALVASIEIILLVVTLLVNRLNLNSKNSSKPPSADPNREKDKKPASERKPGGQKGHNGTTLRKTENPDRIENLKVDRSKLPQGKYKEVGYESRQVVDLDISRIVTEYRAQVLEDENGKKHVAEFPKGVTRPVQYGVEVKVHSVYMSQFQLVPYNRIEDMFSDQLEIPISGGTIYNFNEDAYHRLEMFEAIVKSKLIGSDLIHVDETGINENGKRVWLHSTSNDLWTLYYPHEKRGCLAMDAMGVIPEFNGVLCHDHWKPYFKYDNCEHSLCNAHHLRELERAFEQDGQRWAKNMKSLLSEINQAVNDAGGCLSEKASATYRKKYRSILDSAQIECPSPDESLRKKGSRGRMKRSKARSLLERLITFEKEVLRFMDDPIVPFTNNQGENDIRMTKVQQKISGCFRSKKGAEMFCRIRSYISTCRKHGMRASAALRLLFEGKLPDFMGEI